MSAKDFGNTSNSEKMRSVKYRLNKLNEKKFALGQEESDGDKTMQIILPEEDKLNQTMKIDEGDIQIHPGHLSDQTMQIGPEDFGRNEAERTRFLSDLSQEEESDRTMMINFENGSDSEEAGADRTMMLNVEEEEGGVDVEGSDRTMQIDFNQKPREQSSEHTMLVHFNREDESDVDLDGEMNKPSESKTARYAKVVKPGESKARESSLPLSMSKADESRHQPMGDPCRRSSTPRTLSGSSATMLAMKNDPVIWAWTQTVHPTHGWLVVLLLFPLSGLAFINIAFSWMLPDHPGPLPIIGSDFFTVQYLIPDLATSFLTWFVLAMFAQILFSGAGGRPPLVWTLKMMTFALIPFALVRLGWMGVNLFLSGPESFIRGYRAPWALMLTPVLYTLAGGLTAFLLVKASTSSHCQAKERRARVLFGLIPLIALSGYLALQQMQRWRFEQRVGPAWRRAELAWAHSRSDEALPLLEEVLDYPRLLTAFQKARFYQMRGELRLQEGLILGAREDFVRTVQLLPPSHAENRLARAANLLALDRVDLATVQLQIAEDMRPASANVQRWLARLALGDFDPELKNPALALDYARQAVALEPSGPNKAILERTELALRAL